MKKEIKDIRDIFSDIDSKCIDTRCKACKYKDNGCINKWKAEAFYEAGYRKVDGDEYVSREWHDEQVLHAGEEIKQLKEKLAKYETFIRDREEKAVKDFAEKYKNKSY